MKRLSAACLLAAATPSVWPCDGLSVENAWVREAPPVARTLVAYMDLSNRGAAPVTVTGIRAASIFSGSMLHGTEVVDGVSRMRHVDELPLQPGDQARLEPGGLHLMLFKPSQPLRAGDQVELLVECMDQDALRITVPVRRADAPAAG